MIFSDLGAVIGLTEKFARIAGKVSRIAELQEVVDEIEADQVLHRLALHDASAIPRK